MSFFLFACFFLVTPEAHGIALGQGLNPNHRCGNTGSSTRCAGLESKPSPPQRLCQILNRLHHSRNSSSYFSMKVLLAFLSAALVDSSVCSVGCVP